MTKQDTKPIPMLDETTPSKKTVVLVMPQEDEREVFTRLLHDMGMEVHHADSGRDAIMQLEDLNVDFLVMDVQLTDMHGWKMLGILKESVSLASLPTLVVMDEQNVIPLANVTPIVRPVSVAMLRKTINNLFVT